MASGLGDELGMDTSVVATTSDFQLLFFGGGRLRAGDEVVFLHAIQDVELPRARPLQVVDGVVGGGCFGQSSQHGGFRDADVFERFSEISF